LSAAPSSRLRLTVCEAVALWLQLSGRGAAGSRHCPTTQKAPIVRVDQRIAHSGTGICRIEATRVGCGFEGVNSTIGFLSRPTADPGNEKQRQRVRLTEILRVDIVKLHRLISDRDSKASGAASRAFLESVNPRSRLGYESSFLYCPALPFLWGFRPADGSPASIIHQPYYRQLWRHRRIPGRTVGGQ